MPGLRELCSLFVAGSLGAGSVVAVQKVRAPRPVHRSAPRPAAVAPRPLPPAPPLPECAPAAAAPDIAALGAAAPFAAGGGLLGADLFSGSGPLAGGGGGGGSGGIGGGVGDTTQPRPLPAVPEPAGWAMMVSGFGLIGVALRKGRLPAIG